MRKLEIRPSSFGGYFLVAALTLAVFLPCLSAQLTHWDDDVYVVHNPLVRELSAENVVRMFAAPYEHLYMPLVLLSYAVERHFFGLSPFIYHFDNLLLHLANSLLVLWLTGRLSGRPAAGLIAALLFAVHPLHVESVAWVAERKDVLYVFFYLLAAASYVRYRESGRRYSYVAALGLFVLSCFSKPAAVTFPVVLFLFDYVLGAPARSAVREKVPFFLIALVFGWAAVAADNVATERAGNFIDNILYAHYAVLFYLAKMVAPFELSCYYPMPVKTGGWLPAVFYAAPLAVWGMLGAVFALTRRSKAVVFGALFFLVVLGPNLQFVPSRGFIIVADRYTYLSFFGLFFIAGVLLERALRDAAGRRVVKFAAVTALAVLSVLAWQRCRVWQDGVTLWTDAARKFPADSIIWTNRAVELMARRDWAAAEADLRRAAALDPANPAAHSNLGIVLAEKGDWEGAAGSFLDAIEAKPRFAKAFLYLGEAYERLGEKGPALKAFERAVRIDPGLLVDDGAYPAALNLAIAYAEAGETLRAEESFVRALELRPRSVRVLQNFGAFYANVGRVEKALLLWENALKLEPDNEAVQKNILWARENRKADG